MALCSNETCRASPARIARVSAKCSDMCNVLFPGKEDYTDGYVPGKIGIGGGDYIEFAWCLDCGMIQDDSFPVQVPEDEE